MGIATFPAAAGGGIKLVQRGQAVSAGSITITAVDITKAFVTFVSEGAAGTVATNSTVASTTQTGTLTASGGDIAGSGRQNIPYPYNQSPQENAGGSFPSYSGTRTNTSAAISGGTMDATTKQMGVYLSDSTTLVATGACRWEVVEFA